MKRSNFIKSTCILGAYGCLGSTGFLIGACSSPAYFARYTLESKRLIVPKSEFEYTTRDGKQEQRQLVLVKPGQAPFPIALFRHTNGFSACLMRCTHQGCEVEVQGDRYACPCHGSEFSFSGEVLNGPADQPLQTYKTIENEQQIVIHLV
ncbi:MAG: Rieske (2Fe-2S) protein [Bacteroidetes bacterium]|nr:MAG: Rieske (2Fe-2S) protein [Bacteroidota bacterium]